MGDVDDLVEAFKALRVDEGLTPDKLAGYQGGRLLGLLGTPGDGEAGLQVLGDVVDTMLEPAHAWASNDLGTKMQKRLIQRAVRVALAIGDDDGGASLATRGILSERRDWACGVGLEGRGADVYFKQADTRTLARYESSGLRVLARLIVGRMENPAFQQTADRQLEQAGYSADFAPVAPLCLDVVGEEVEEDQDTHGETARSTEADVPERVRFIDVWRDFGESVREMGGLNREELLREWSQFPKTYTFRLIRYIVILTLGIFCEVLFFQAVYKLFTMK
ncbi:hypothetical protein [Streptomyces sp. NPDC003688]